MKLTGSGLLRIIRSEKPLFHTRQNFRHGQQGETSLRNSSGMTLIELAVVLAVVGLMAGAIVPLARSYFQDRIRTQISTRLDEDRNALLSFWDTRQVLPCPDTTGDGQADCSGSGNVLYGTLPFADLGVPPNDGTARPVYYAVLTQFTEHTSVTDALRSQRCETLAALPPDHLVVQDNGQDVNVPFLVLSGGAENRDGAGDQRDGENADTNGVYERRPPADNFDDLLEYASPFPLAQSGCGTLVVFNQSGTPFLGGLDVEQRFDGAWLPGNIDYHAADNGSTKLLKVEKGSWIRVVDSATHTQVDQFVFGGGAMNLVYPAPWGPGGCPNYPLILEMMS